MLLWSMSEDTGIRLSSPTLRLNEKIAYVSNKVCQANQILFAQNKKFSNPRLLLFRLIGNGNHKASRQIH